MIFFVLVPFSIVRIDLKYLLSVLHRLHFASSSIFVLFDWTQSRCYWELFVIFVQSHTSILLSTMKQPGGTKVATKGQKQIHDENKKAIKFYSFMAASSAVSFFVRDDDWRVFPRNRVGSIFSKIYRRYTLG